MGSFLYPKAGAKVYRNNHLVYASFLPRGYENQEYWRYILTLAKNTGDLKSIPNNLSMIMR